MKKKGLAMVLALVLLAVCAVSGTLAWLTAKSDTVTNTFTTSDITVKLKETTGDEYQMIPGYTISKDPKAWVVAGSVDCYLFVKLEKSANFDTYLTYEMADGWAQVPGVSNVYYRTVNSTQMSSDNGDTNSYPVIKGNTVTVKGTVTKEMMSGLTAETYPTLKITAYASQLNSTNNTPFTVEQAWANGPTTP